MPVEMHIATFEIVLIDEVAAAIVVVEMKMIAVPIGVGVRRIRLCWRRTGGRIRSRLGKCRAGDRRDRGRDNQWATHVRTAQMKLGR